MNAPILGAAAAALTGSLCASLPSCVPGLHVYNLLGVMILLQHVVGVQAPSHLLIPFSAAMVTTFAVLNTLPSILLAAPDESAMFTVLPGQKMMMKGRGHHAVLLTGLGSAAGLLMLVIAFTAGAPLLPRVYAVFRPHTHWILWSVIAFMLMSEWPKPSPSGQAGWRRFFLAWRSTGMGILVFLLSGLLGFILFNRSPLAPEAAFQSLMPAFVGLFTLPWLLINIATSVQPPLQLKSRADEGRVPADIALRGVVAGALGGGFAAFFPVVTGGVGGMLAGHATALRDDRAFLISQGVSKLVYYAGGLLLLFVPGLEITRGGAAALIGIQVNGGGPGAYGLAMSGITIGGATALLLLSPLSRMTLALTERYRYRRISSVALVLMCAMVMICTGPVGIGIMCIAAAIGTLPVLYGARRMNALGIILLPMACNLSGIGPAVAAFLHLL